MEGGEGEREKKKVVYMREMKEVERRGSDSVSGSCSASTYRIKF